MKLFSIILTALICLSCSGQTSNTLNVVGTGTLPGNQLLYQDDLVFRIDKRSDLILEDKVGTKDVTILIPTFMKDADGSAQILGDASRDGEKWFTGTSYTLYFQFKRMDFLPQEGSDDIVEFGGGVLDEQRGLHFQSFNGNFWILSADGTTGYSSAIGADINALFDSTEVYDVIVTVTTSAITCNIYDQDGDAVITPYSQDITAYDFNTDNNFTSWKFNSEYFVITNVKKFSAIKTLVQCQTDSVVYNLQVHVPNVWAAADISGNQIDFAYSEVTTADIVYTATHDWLLRYGFDAFENGWNATTMRQIGRSVDGTINTPSRVAATFWVASRLVYERGPSDYVTLRDCKLRFTHAFFDRSNSTIWADTARSEFGYYDSDNPSDFHITELNQKWIYDALNTGYRGKLYVDWDDNSVEEWDRRRLTSIFLYDTDKTGDSQFRILAQTNDIITTVRDATGDTVCDGSGYLQMGRLKADTGMLVFRLDDGFNDIYDTWKPFLDPFDIEPFVGIHPAEAGNSQYHGFDTLRLLQDDDYIMVANNDSDIDYSTLYYVDRIELDMTNTVNAMRSENLTVNHYMGNRHSSSNPTIDYIAHKLGLKTHHTAANYTADSTYGICSLYPDLFRLQSMPLDINVPAGNLYNLSNSPNTDELAAIKAQLDICLAEKRMVIMFVHTYRENVKDALVGVGGVFEYAVANDIPIYNLDEALEHIRYLMKLLSKARMVIR